MIAFRFISSFLVAVLLAVVVSPVGLAQDIDIQVQVTVPEQVQLNEEVLLVIEVTDQEGNPVEGADPEIAFDPGYAVVDEVLYDCGDSEWYDGCRVNHRGVAGIFEVAFELIEEEVKVSVDVAGLQQLVELDASESSAVIPQAKAALAPADEPATLAQVQVGPTPSFWFVILPLVALCAVVAFFVLSTSD